MRALIGHYIGGGWGKEHADDRHTSRAHVIRGTDFSEIVEGLSDTVPCRFHTPSNVSSRQLEVGDIVFEVSGGSKDQPVGRTVLVKESTLALFDGFVIPASFCKRIVINKDVADAKYVYYLLAALYRDRILTRWQTQSTGITNFNFERFLDECDVNLPTRAAQEHIARILSDYDELIENNLRRIRLLDAMAKAIYREWLVDRRVPEVSDSSSSTPNDWPRRTLATLVCDHIGGGWGKELPDSRHSEVGWVIRGTDIPGARRCEVEKVPRRFHVPSNIAARRLQEGDILFEVSGGSKGNRSGELYLSPLSC
jgi:type I restriction enzyme S subunit